MHFVIKGQNVSTMSKFDQAFSQKLKTGFPGGILLKKFIKAYYWSPAWTASVLAPKLKRWYLLIPDILWNGLKVSQFNGPLFTLSSVWKLLIAWSILLMVNQPQDQIITRLLHNIELWMIHSLCKCAQIHVLQVQHYWSCGWVVVNKSLITWWTFFKPDFKPF